MARNSSFLILLASLYLMDFAIAKMPCKTEVSVAGMALKGFVFKKVPVTAPYVCDTTCERETICQSYNYVIGEKSCELNSRTKEARPENFQPDDLRFYMGRISGRTPLGSIPELPALSCQEIKSSEGEDSISKNYWLDPTNVGSSKLVYCDMNLEDIDECKGSNKVCDENANCSNTVGFYNCTCKEGFTGDGRFCSDIDECKGNHSCHVNAKCNNTLGSHTCECQPGYTGNGQNCKADPCYYHQNLNDASRKSSYPTPQKQEVCDDHLVEEWYRFVGAAGTKMPTTRVPAYRCGTQWSGWLDADHPTVEEGEVRMTVCFSDRSTGCRYTGTISVKNCGSYFIYRLKKPPNCNSRYCSTD
ncbi:unnamed protein product [Pocillopora meandrina]|uniref:Uncharacterized protein n=1 Tax=Pocillopora meandrina TaxID=46732 RepID=A0AAU9XBK2_9CNID|nr:unnamed protein product [Pocillopora meandrina]